jgi:predicted O-methyltransferase YrrM
MNLFEKIIVKTLAMPSLKKTFYWGWSMYHLALLDDAQNHTLNETYRNIKKYKLDLQQDIPYRDAKAIEQLVLMSLKKDMVVVEIGSWKGFSTSVIARTIKSWNGNLYAIDHWQGSEGVVHHDQAKIDDILSIFRTNMKALDLDNVLPMVMTSLNAAKIFANESVDFIFIDADHRYSGIMNDLKYWLPKLKKGGIIGGHDCEDKYTNFGDYYKVIDQYCEQDVIVGTCHAGVVKALYDTFGNDYSIIPNSTIWWKKV